MPHLWLIPAEGEPIAVKTERILLGRDPACDVVIGDSSVSRRHAVVERHPEGWFVVDQSSANGVTVNGQRVHQAALLDGQELRLGVVAFGVALRERAPRPAQARQSPAPANSAPPLPTATRTVAGPKKAGMREAEAASLLGVSPGASAAEVRRRYQKLRKDLQVKLTNAPTPSLRRMYQKNLQELKAACEALFPAFVE